MAVKNPQRKQNPDLLSMVGLGTSGGQLRADGSTMESGVHLRWQIGESLGFPPGGFDLYRRRQNLDLYARCGTLAVTDLGEIFWVPVSEAGGQLMDFTPSGRGLAIRGCGQKTQSSISLPGRQTLRLRLRDPARHLRITFDRRTRPTPIATAFCTSPEGPVSVERQTAVQSGNEWILRLFSDRIDEVIVRGEDMIICEICVVLVKDGYEVGWDPLPLNDPYRIYLPITHPVWGSPHAHAPDDNAEAEARLPVNLPIEKHQTYAKGFSQKLHSIIYDLVGTDPQHLHHLTDADATGVILDWPGLQLLKLMALDPNLARTLGLYWHDATAVPDQFYDYRLVAHYTDVPGVAHFDVTPVPGKRYDYATLQVGRRYGTILELEGLRYISPNPMDVVQSEWSASLMSALFIETALQAPISITLPDRVPVTVLYVSASAEVTATAYLGSKVVVTLNVSAGQQGIVLQTSDGMDALRLETLGDLTIFEIVLRPTAETLNDIEYVTFHHRVEQPPPLAVPELNQPVSIASRTGLDETGSLVEHQSSIGLHWTLPETSGNGLRAGAPVLYHVRRADQGKDERPAPITEGVILNEHAPMVITERRNQPPAPQLGMSYIDRSIADGWYSYQVHGIDLFGRLGNWCQPQTVRTLDRLPPPTPQSVTAHYLDPADPWLSESDKEWATANGTGLRVNWEWPGMFRLQAPDVIPPDAEFRIYSKVGELNSVRGNVISVTHRGTTSELVTDLSLSTAPDELSGEYIRVGGDFFEITGNSTGNDCLVTVINLTAPVLMPEPGPCTIVFSRERSYWTDYGVTTNWEKRSKTAAVADTAVINGQVANVRNYVEHPVAIVSRPGATHTVVTDQALEDNEGVLVPGALLCDGVVYQAYGHTLGNKLRIHIAPQISPTDSALLVMPTANASFTYYPGRRYETYIPDFILEVDPRKGSAVAQVAVSCSDGKSHTADNPVWRQPDRGGLGDRVGNEGPLSTASKVTAVKRSLPLAPQNVAVASEPVFAKPANYYGRAHYTLEWETVTDSIGYAVYRCTGATLFDHDRMQRQNGKDYYSSHGVFADDADFASWLATYDASLSAHELITNAKSHLADWRAWADHFYPALTDAQVQDLANRSGNERALRRVNKDPVEGTTYTDTFDGRGQGFYLYRVRSIDGANNQSAWSATYPAVHIYDVTLPATPVITAVEGGENQITLKWAKNPGVEISGYLLYRTQDKEKSKDWSQMELIKTNDTDTYSIEVAVLPDKEFEFIDHTVIARQLYYYGLVAVRLDDSSNSFISRLSSAKSGQAYDLSPPEAPQWDQVNSGWVYMGGTGEVYETVDDVPEGAAVEPAIRLGWEVIDEKLTYRVQRNDEDSNIWKTILDFDDSFEITDQRVTLIDRGDISASASYYYRVDARSQSECISLNANRITIYG